jgi:hypothetical protein
MAWTSTATASITSTTGSRLEFKGRKDARDVMNVQWLVRLDDHVAAVVADPDHKLVNGEARWHLPVFEDLQYAFMCGLVFSGRRRRTLAPADNIFHGQASSSRF